jgi:hypothetical protein
MGFSAGILDFSGVNERAAGIIGAAAIREAFSTAILGAA